jgi:hypothetical protein
MSSISDAAIRAASATETFRSAVCGAIRPDPSSRDRVYLEIGTIGQILSTPTGIRTREPFLNHRVYAERIASLRRCKYGILKS